MNARTHRAALAIAGAILVSALPAAAETPPFLPTVPFSATVFAPGLDGPSGSAEVFHAGHVFRVEAGMPQGGNLTVLIDVPRQTQTIYMDIQGQRIRSAMPWGQSGLGFLTGTPTGTLPVELGPDTVAGEPCTNYIMADGGANVCYTSDGVPLRLQDPARGVVYIATRFQRGPQPASHFKGPAGYQEMNMPFGILCDPSGLPCPPGMP